MKSLIIVKGLAKTEKLNWVKEERLENYFLDIDVFRKLYSTPELIKPDTEALGRSFGSLIYQRFIEALIIRLGKGCLVVVDLDEEPVNSIELLAMIHGYTVFYLVQPIPQDFCNKPKKYCLPWQVSKKKEELDNDVKNFMNLQLGDKNIIKTYQNIIKYWSERENVIRVKKKDIITHISDLHSNWSLWCDIMSELDTKLVIHHGDYIDGPEKGGSKKLIQEILKDDQHIWLEGNHELRLRRYLGWKLASTGGGNKTVADLLYSLLPDDFLKTTALEFESLNHNECRKWLIELNKKLKTHVIIVRGCMSYICTHAGLKMVEQLSPKYIGNVIYGNRDIDRYDKEFSHRNSDSNFISVHAHCKYPQGWNTNKYNRVFNIDPENETKVVVFNNSKDNWSFKVWQN